MVSQRGIEVSPDQVKAVMETPPPRNKKELQRLTGKLVALGRFIARFTDSCDPSSWQYEKLERTDGRTVAKTLWKELSIVYATTHLEQPHPKGEIIHVSGGIRMGNQRRSIPLPSPKEQKPIYYVSRALADVETRYSKMELTALALRSAAQKLRPYFQAHPVIVLTDQPLRNILHKPDLTGRMLQWAIELSEFGIEFQPGSGVGSYCSPQRGTFGQAIRLGFSASNNEAEYEPSCPDWTSPLLYPSPNSGSTDSQLVLPPSLSKKPFYPYMCNPTPLSQKFQPAIPLRHPKRMAKNGCMTSQNISGQELYPESQTGTQSPGASCPFHLNWGHLYKRSFTGPYLRCLGHSEAQYVLAELHEGICGNHSGGRSLAHRAHSQGYYWPTMKKDAAAYVKRCDKCQRYAPIPHMPSTTLKSISGPWPFAQWGMDIVGPLPAAPAQKKFLLVATYYFSKWVEAEAYASIKDKDVTKNFCSELNIRNSYSTPRYPQSNGQAEATNKTLITALKKRLEQAKGKWVEELPGVLWAYRTTPGRPTGNTPFALAYGMDAVIPTEIGLPTIRTDAAKQSDANMELRRNLDWTDEVRESAAIRMADYQQRASAHYNRKVRPRSFKNGYASP
ncbi:Pro-Pol polyprotein [Vitis vinifera]|uniref:Pro-Pol polyprotein n=1 Tax=Vitis vinifera TaxID=29760 RepID=A0A438CZ71_VITVI|nr:Pro-Pol polyprotein [Vitis vinifera]